MRPLRFGLLGVGYFGRNYLRLLQDIEGVELAAVCSRSRESLAGISSMVPGSVIRTTDASAVLKRHDIDCVVVATPASTHFALASEALEMGKNVLVEKPMVTSLEEARKLRAAVKKAGSTFMVGHQYVYNDYARFLKGMVGKGSFGTVRHVLCEHLCFPVRNDIGSFWDAASHHLSMIQFLFSPGKIVGVAGSSMNDFTAASVRFSSGLAATLVTTWFGAKKTRSFTIAGDKALAVFDDVEETAKIRLFPGNKAPVVAAKEPLRNEVGHFIGCIRSSKEPLTGISNGFRVIEWIDRIEKSLRKS
ncbi:Gfo/Idh/MocA family oxidoreductase [Candidatus Woesearchaeota archaeon]|nr:Gfo/Idh/MocA family oxidoreductase [Candidatus Woesearchaeota archaeon]